MSVIGLVGRKSSGKTTTANYLVKKYGFVEIVFAEPVKRVTETIFGFPYDMLLGDTPEKRVQRNTLRDPIWNKTPVEAMQYIGTDLFRNCMDSDVWIKIAKRKVSDLIAKGKNVVISDVRFPNEMRYIREEMNGTLWVLHNDPAHLKPLSTEEILKGGTEYHASEVSYQTALLENDVRLFNPVDSDPLTGISELHNKIDALLHC